MKKLILTIITLSIITYTGCYDPDTATVRINLGNMPIAKHETKSLIDRVLGLFVKEAWADPLENVVSGIVKVHVAALSGQSVLATASLDASEIEAYNIEVVSDVWVSYLDLEVPAGNNITILVVAESYNANNDTYYASYYGYNMVDLKPGETTSAQISMEDISDYISFNRSLSQVPPYYLYWDKLPGATVIISGSTSGEIYRDKGTRVNVEAFEDVYTANVIFEFIGLSYSTTF